MKFQKNEMQLISVDKPEKNTYVLLMNKTGLKNIKEGANYPIIIKHNNEDITVYVMRDKFFQEKLKAFRKSKEEKFDKSLST